MPDERDTADPRGRGDDGQDGPHRAEAGADAETHRGSEVALDRAVLDRIVDGRTAVLLVGPDGDELLLPVSRLPDGSGEGTWFELDLATEPPAVTGIDQALTDARTTDISTRLDRIRQERRGGRFSR